VPGGIAIALLSLVTAGWVVASRTLDESQPASYRVVDQALWVLDSRGRPLFKAPVAGPVDADAFAANAASAAPPVAIADLDGDGQREVLVHVVGAQRTQRTTLQCFNADGTERWRRELRDRQRFGDQEFGPTWLVYRFFVRPEADGTQTVWIVYIADLLYPSLLEQVAPDGTVRSRYWSNGYVESVNVATWQGRPTLLVGANSNEYKGGALALLDRDAPSGVSPALNPKYRCATCPGQAPRAFLVFPPTPVGKVRDQPTGVPEAWVTEQGELTVSVRDRVHDLPHYAINHFTIDEQWRLLRIEVTADYRQLHDTLFGQKRIDRPYTDAEEAHMEVLRWEDGRFVPVTRAR
jgi:hypothetical protein